MDIISFNEASTANGRIESFIENPDSTSGVLTVPKTIAAGETITIPAGRVAILPDLQVDGDLVIDGDLFIPTGSMTSQVVQKVTSTDNAIARYDGTTGQVQNSGIFIDDNNNVGIGTSSPTEGNLHIHSTTTSNIKFTNTTTGQTVNDGLFVGIDFAGDAYVFNKEAKTLNLGTNNLHRMIIDSSGNVGIGVTPSAWTTYKVLELGAGNGMYGSNGPGQELHISNNAYYNSGYKYALSYSASDYKQEAGTHQWRTAPLGTAGNTITWTNAMTLDANGRLLVGSNGLNPIQGVTIRNESTIGVVDIGHASGTANGNQYNGYYYNGTLIGSILQSGTTSVVYNTTSDYRLKENIRPADCKKFMDIKFVDYERIDGRHECGVIAHELQEIYPDLVTGEKDATEIRKVEISPAVAEVKDEDGNVITEAVEAVYEEQEFPVYQQVNYIGLIARIGTVVQQQAKLIEAMQLEINELKGAK